MQSTNISLYYDVSPEFEIDGAGNLEELWGKDAYKSAITLYITSKRGDIIRDPLKGGPIYPYIGKVMSDDNRLNIRDMLDYDLREYFGNALELKYIRVEPDYNKRIWYINIVYIIKNIAEQDEVNLSLLNDGY